MGYMKLLTGDLQLGLDAMFTKHGARLGETGSGRVYLPRLREQLTQIDGLPAAAEGRPLVEELAQIDARHDGYGTAIWFQCESYLRAETTSIEHRVAILELREALVGDTAELRESYADEAAAARAKEPALVKYRPLLKSIPLLGGITLDHWARAFVKAGKALGETLEKRADLSPRARTAAGSLRGRTLGLLNRFREALRDEFAASPEEGQALDEEVFAYFDTLEAQRGESAPVAAVSEEEEEGEGKEGGDGSAGGEKKGG